MKERPYVGVTGLSSRLEVAKTLYKGFSQTNLSIESERIPMIGFLVSLKTLNRLPTENLRYPNIKILRELWQESKYFAFNTVHYNTQETKALSEQVITIFAQGIYDRDYLQGLQFNMKWPDRHELLKVKRVMPDLKIIISVFGGILKESTPQEVAQKIESYGLLVDYLLLDPSGGHGKTFEAKEVVPYFQSLRDKFPNLALGVAGGFTGENVGSRVRELILELGITDFSIDAEGGLRDKVSPKYGDDLFNLEKTVSYIKAADQAFIR